LARWLDVILVVDEWPSMVIWQQTVIAWQRFLERHGAFRNLQLWGCRTNPDTGRVWLHVGTGPEATQRRVRSPRELIDPRGQRLFLVISDCIAPSWSNGKIAQMLAMWGQNSLVTLVHMLPERLWSHSGLAQAVPVSLRARAPALPNRLL